ncbi:hypothetical protein Clacol_009608 [Clathrus columnatus]|uniref:Alpha-galactosidase n=1 Tax=Clathrus columnatus TaxID=1419009 RepID=A0AAV5AKY8_9AGAM|nr:hypothetical protein Clacol_009608 [Clathrus columnatus]
MFRITFSLLTLITFTVNALNNGVGKTPVMGYNGIVIYFPCSRADKILLQAWNVFQCNINENLLLEQAKLLKSLGLFDVGYKQFNLDDCWAQKNRTAEGLVMPDSEKFPSGFNSFTDQLHQLGFKAGIYSDSGWFTCAGYPGSFEHEESDVEQFTGWGFDFLKYDNCYIPFDDIIREGIVGKYQRMADAIAEVAKKKGGSPMLFSLCEWGWLLNAWCLEANWNSLASIIDTQSFIASATDFYGHNDMDMLQLGNGGLTFEESNLRVDHTIRSHFTAWALSKSPLLIGTNLSAVTPDIVSILKNEEIIAINQDPEFGTSVTPFRWGIYPDWVSNPSSPAQYWSGQSQNGTVFMILNTQNEPAEMFFSLTESPWIRAGRQYAVRDLWAHTNNGTAIRNMTFTLPPHGVAALVLTDAGDEPAGISPPCAVLDNCSAENGTQFN